MSKLIASNFEKEIANWQEKLKNDEWFFVSVREKLIKDLPANQIFSEIDQVISFIIDQHDKYLIYEGFLLLFDMYRKIDTTEQTKLLKTEWNFLKNLVNSCGEQQANQFREFEKWFRVA